MNVLHAVVVHPFVNAVYHLYGYGRVNEVCRTNFNSRSTRHKEFNSIRSVHNTTKTNDGDVDCLCHLHHHAKRNGLYARTAKTSSADAELCATALYVNSRAH